ncbi:MAG: hypothetical protein WB586_08855 [Chthoniobacterales bacterium]
MTVLLAILSWLALSTILGLAFAFSPAGLTSTTAAVSLGAGLLVAVAVALTQKRRAGHGGETNAVKFDPRKISVTHVIVAAAFLAFAFRAFSQVIFVRDGEVRVLSPNNLGDICLHLTHINYLASNPRFWPENPIFAFDKLRYPIGLNLFNAQLKLVGVEPKLGIILVGLLCSLLTLRALFLFNGPFGVAAFLFNGGLAGLLFFQGFEWKDYQDAVAWKSIPLALFVTQRGLLYAIPAGLALLTHWRTKFFQEWKNPSSLNSELRCRAAGPAADTSAVGLIPSWAECLLYATMPLFHLHTFIFLSFLLLCWFLFGDRKWRTHLLRLVALSFVPAALLVYWVTGFAKTGAIAWKPGWMTPPDQPPWWFWLNNFGLFLPLTFALLIYLCVPGSPMQQEQKRMLRLFCFPAAIVFLACAFIRFAPWEWDNTKLLIWSYLVLMFGLWTAFLSRWHILLRSLALTALFFSGFLSLAGGLRPHQEGYRIGDEEEWQQVAEATRTISPAAIFAAYPTYNHPVLVTGHRVVLGFPGHLWSHGLNYRPYEVLLSQLMLGQPGWKDVGQTLHADYLFWGKFEETQYADSRRPWENECKVVADGPWGRIYDLRPKAAR